MILHGRYWRVVLALGILGGLVGCDEPRAVLLPLQYPDGTPVQTMAGDPVMAGYQTYGSPVHANATALYETAASTACVTCARLGAVVSEPSVLRQATGFLGASTVGAGAVMAGVGAMNYGNAAEDGKLGTNVTQNVSAPQHADNRRFYPDRPAPHDDHDTDHDGDRDHDHNDYADAKDRYGYYAY
jgi:hypothetical protein